MATSPSSLAPPPSRPPITSPGIPIWRTRYRVLNGDGSVSFNFRWHDDSDTRDPMEVLIGEGVEFDENGCASQAQRLRPAELEALLDPEPPAGGETGS